MTFTGQAASKGQDSAFLEDLTLGGARTLLPTTPRDKDSDRGSHGVTE